MSETPNSADWSKERGQKWVDNLQTLENMLEPVNAPLIDALELPGARSLADIGCGGGDTLRAIGDCVATDVRLHGIDISPDVIGAATRATTRENISYHCLDAGTAPPAFKYDRLSSRFGVMFFDDPGSAFRNLSNWLKPDGLFAFAVWGPLIDNPWMGVARQTVARFVAMPKPEPDSPGPFRYGDAERFADLLVTAGFCELSVHDWRGSIAVGGGVDAATAARFSLTAFSMGLLVGDDQALEARIHDALRAQFQAHEVKSVVTLPARVNIITGRGAGS